MTSFTTIEGEAHFDVPSAGKPCQTWYRITTPTTPDPPRIPLIIIHGGPGMTHQYLTPHTDLTEKYGIPVILYDQIGCGFSTHLQEKAMDRKFWVEELFIKELENLISHLKLTEYDVLGSSWGGMFGSRFASRQPAGLRRLILANSPGDMIERYKSAAEYRKELPLEEQAILKKHEDADTEDSDECNTAFQTFVRRHICNIYPFPPELQASMEYGNGKDNTTVRAMEGKRKWRIEGAKKDWNMIGEAKKINVPTLLVYGNKEIASDAAMKVYWREIPKVKWVKLMGSTHTPHLEERERYMEIVGEFLIDE